MSLRVRYGTFAAIERALSERLDELKAGGPLAPVAVVTPSRRLADRLERFLTLERGRALLGVRFHTFHSLARAVLEDSGRSPGAQAGDPLLHDRLIDAVLFEQTDLARRFGGAARPKAFASALRSSLRDLVDAGVDPDSVLEHIGDDWPEGPAASQRLKDLLELQRSYLAALAKRGLLPPSGAAAAAAQAAESSKYLARYRELLYYGFYDLTGSQLDLFERVAAAHPATLFFPYRKGHPAYRFADEFFELKLHRGGEPPLAVESEARGPAELRVINASGARDEAWRVSKEVLRLAEEEGVAFDDIGVVARALEPYRAALAEAFEADAVPYEPGTAEPLLRHPVARLALDLLAGTQPPESPYLRPGLWERPSGNALRAWGDWSADALEFLHGRIALPRDASQAEAAAWAAVLAATDEIAAFEPLGAVAWAFFLDTLVEKLEGAVLEMPPRRGVRVLDAMDARGESFKVLFLVGLQEGLFPRQVREDPLLRDEARARLRHPGGYWIARKFAGYEEERLLFHLLVESARERLYCVHSRSDEDGRALTPSWYLRELCRARGVDLSTVSEHVPRRPIQRLAACPPTLLSPREAALRLVAAGADAAGLLDRAGLDGTLTRGARDRMRLLNAGGRAGPMDGRVGPQKEFLENLLRRGLSPSALDSFARCPFQFFAVRALGLKEPEEPDDRGELAPRLQGTLYHAVLERFYRRLRDEGFWKRREPGPWMPALEEAVQETLRADGWRQAGVYALVWKAACARMQRRLQRFVEWDLARIGETGLAPARFEVELRGPLPLPRLPAGLAGLEFHGFADRVDLDEERRRYRVVDYKARWPKSRGRLDQQVYSGRMHQPPVYAELAPGVLPKGASEENDWNLEGVDVYALEASEESRLQAYPGAAWEADRDSVLDAVSEQVAELAKGVFPIRPQDGEHGYCRWCVFPAMCRKSHGRSRARAEAQYEGSTLQKIHERKRPRS